MLSNEVIEINMSKYYFQPIDNGDYEAAYNLIEQVRLMINRGAHIRLYKESFEVKQLVWKDGRFQYDSTIYQTPEKIYIKDIYDIIDFEEWEKYNLDVLRRIHK